MFQYKETESLFCMWVKSMCVSVWFICLHLKWCGVSDCVFLAVVPNCVVVAWCGFSLTITQLFAERPNKKRVFVVFTLSRRSSHTCGSSFENRISLGHI